MHDVEELAAAQSLSQITDFVQRRLKCAGVWATKTTQDQLSILANSGFDLGSRFGANIPVTHSICHHVVAMNFPLIIDDTVGHPLLVGNFVFEDLGIVAYAGAPTHENQSIAVGSICALELSYRRWTAEDIKLVLLAAEAADQLVPSSK